MRELIYFVAVTMDGFIAREDGSIDGFPWDDEYGAELMNIVPEMFPAPFRKDEITRDNNKWFDAVLMGRKTYELGLNQGVTDPYQTLDQYVFSQTIKESPDDNVTVTDKSPVEVVKRLKEEPGKAIWLCGGAQLASILLNANQIDKLILKLNPVIFGKGIPLFLESIALTNLILTDHRIFKSGHAILHYNLK